MNRGCEAPWTAAEGTVIEDAFGCAVEVDGELLRGLEGLFLLRGEREGLSVEGAGDREEE